MYDFYIQVTMHYIKYSLHTNFNSVGHVFIFVILFLLFPKVYLIIYSICRDFPFAQFYLCKQNHAKKLN